MTVDSGHSPPDSAGDLRPDRSTTVRLADAETKIAQLEHALKSRIVIEQAKGILAERLGIDVNAAFEILRSAARSQRQRLHETARQVVDGESTPSPVLAAIVRSEHATEEWIRKQAGTRRDRLAELECGLLDQLAVGRRRGHSG